MTKPDLNKLPNSISPGDLSGWYSTILAENTRMLMRGVIPTLCTAALTDYYYNHGDKTGEDYRQEDRIAAGSSNILMKYSARLYCVLNGVSDLRSDPGKLYNFFSCLFAVFWQRSLSKWATNGFFKKQSQLDSMKQFSISIPSEKMTNILAWGLALEDPTMPPNRAMEYLACHGEHLPLHIGDGIGLKDALELHLKKYYYSREQEEQEVISLSAAWAPASTEKSPIGSLDGHQDHLEDIHKLASHIVEKQREKGVVHLILRQSCVNAEAQISWF